MKSSIRKIHYLMSVIVQLPIFVRAIINLSLTLIVFCREGEKLVLELTVCAAKNIFYVYWLSWYAAHVSINHIKAFQNFIFHLTLTDNLNHRTNPSSRHFNTFLAFKCNLYGYFSYLHEVIICYLGYSPTQYCVSFVWLLY